MGAAMVGILKRRTENPSEDRDDETDASIAEYGGRGPPSPRRRPAAHDPYGTYVTTLLWRQNILKKDKKVVVYSRTSTPNQKKAPLDLVKALEKFGYENDNIEAIPDAASGSAERKGFDRLVDLVAKGEVGLVVVDEASRASRSAEEYERFRDACRATGTLIYGVSTGTLETW
jgi:hypothetical protein